MNQQWAYQEPDSFPSVILKVTSATAEKQAMQRICCFVVKCKACFNWRSIQVTECLLSRFQNYLMGKDSNVFCNQMDTFYSQSGSKRTIYKIYKSAPTLRCTMLLLTGKHIPVACHVNHTQSPSVSHLADVFLPVCKLLGDSEDDCSYEIACKKKLELSNMVSRQPFIFPGRCLLCQDSP